MISVTSRGSYQKTEEFLKRAQSIKLQILTKYAEAGLRALSIATPKDSGLTASSWYYEIIQKKDSVVIEWKNRNIVKYANIALLLQYGHATNGGGYVKGIDYINPALKPIFKELADSAWKEVVQK